MLFVHPSRDFIREHKTSIKIEIDNNLSLGWKPEDIIFATNFPFEYRGVKSILVSNDCYDAEISPCASIIFVIVDLFKRNLIQKGELYWYHDTDLYQLEKVTESEVDLGSSDMGVVDWGTKISASSFFFKSGAKDIFLSIKEIMYKHRVDEEVAMQELLTKNLDVGRRVKKLNITYDFETGYLNQHYKLATKPIKTAHFHYTRDYLLDSAMYGKNSLHKPLMPERLIKIFHNHGVKGTAFKKMKNLMIYQKGSENLVKRQIENSLKMGWKKKDIVLLSGGKAEVIFNLLSKGEVKEGELWWYHDLDVLQAKPFDSSEIDLEDRLAGFKKNDMGKLDLTSLFFRIESDKIFEWIKNRARKFGGDEEAALNSLASENYRDINRKYIRLG